MWRYPRTGESEADSRDLRRRRQANGHPHGPRSSGQNLLINPAREFANIHDRMGQLMNIAFGGCGPFAAGVPWAPPADMTGTDDAYVVHVELPGVSYLPGEVKADAVSAQLSDGVLTVNMPKSEAAKPRKFEITG